MLQEHNVRKGFFEPEQFASVMRHLPEPLRAVADFAYQTGWRVPSEVLPLEWSRVDFTAGTVVLDPHTTKNGEPRVFPMTTDLRSLLEAQDKQRAALKKAGHIVPWVFVRMVAKGRRGAKSPKRIKSFIKAWRTACLAAGCPGRIPHDCRRTAARKFDRAGIPRDVAKLLMGHKTDSVYSRYRIVSHEDLKDAARKLDAAMPTLQQGAR
jgi:integrase